ncbi:hypothetical protein [Aurantiacibacter gangjinensis]|uniref:Uncharacterized protein n=1 Tax=Aurantiacibacter gangjinensis TaxID=502682 RepID=A0A0G9MMG6_9SPHN|nr:hypothetical protein [Aurantiacibacter gangjinensis]KLE31926.1 hypothetical protein AAW01_10795 [Aurantiacibacter gangjinensis]
MAARSRPDVTQLAFQSWMLGCEAGWVMWLRTMRIMSGGALAEREVQRMVSEKFVANAMLWPALMMGGAGQSAETLGARTLSHYGKRVRANRRRLSR